VSAQPEVLLQAVFEGGFGFDPRHSPGYFTDVLLTAALHLLPYVTPSQPHTGECSFWQVVATGTFAHIPRPTHPCFLSQKVPDEQSVFDLQPGAEGLHEPWLAVFVRFLLLKHALLYVFPSQPHTGEKKVGQFVGS